MTSHFSSITGEVVELEITGNRRYIGVLIDSGQDILVLYNGENFIYFPFVHVVNMMPFSSADFPTIVLPTNTPLEDDSEISYRQILTNAKGMFTELLVTGNQTIHGYITGIMTNYFVFYSPVYKTIFIPMFHLKWLIPHSGIQTPYSLNRNLLPINSSNISNSRTFEAQVEKFVGNIVVCDLGLHPSKIGLLSKMNNNFLELVTADYKKIFCHIHHIKSIHCPSL
jgi:hypothetical protein